MSEGMGRERKEGFKEEGGFSLVALSTGEERLRAEK